MIRRVKVEADDLILNRLLVWNSDSRKSNDGGFEKAGDVGTESGLVLADFDEHMNLVLMDFGAVFGTNDQQR